MVEAESGTAPVVRASDFVGRTQGKLRDFYRIGKVLGTGKSPQQARPGRGARSVDNNVKSNAGLID